MQVVADNKYAAALRKKLFDFYRAENDVENKKRQKDHYWHVSDLVHPRATVLKVLKGEEVTDESIGLWFFGKAAHTELQRILGKKYAEVEKTWNNVVSHIDHFDKVLMEIKTSRKWTIPEMPDARYIRQVGFYAAMTGTRSVKLVVVYPTANRKWDGKNASTVEFRVWEISFTNHDLAQIKESMLATISAINFAIKRKSFEYLPPCPKWLCKEDGGNFDEVEERAYPFYYTDIEGYSPEEKKVYVRKK